MCIVQRVAMCHSFIHYVLEHWHEFHHQSIFGIFLYICFFFSWGMMGPHLYKEGRKILKKDKSFSKISLLWRYVLRKKWSQRNVFPLEFTMKWREIYIYKSPIEIILQIYVNPAECESCESSCPAYKVQLSRVSGRSRESSVSLDDECEPTGKRRILLHQITKC